METPAPKTVPDLLPIQQLTLAILVESRTRKQACKRLGITRDALYQRLQRICRELGKRPISKMVSELTDADLAQVARVQARFERAAGRDSVNTWQYTFGAMNPRQRRELAAQIQNDAREIAARLGCANRLLPLLA